MGRSVIWGLFPARKAGGSMVRLLKCFKLKNIQCLNIVCDKSKPCDWIAGMQSEWPEKWEVHKHVLPFLNQARPHTLKERVLLEA